jgi:hypothetical protein
MIALESSLNDDSNARLLLLLIDAIMHVDIKSLVCVCVKGGIDNERQGVWKMSNEGDEHAAANVRLMHKHKSIPNAGAAKNCKSIYDVIP